MTDANKAKIAKRVIDVFEFFDEKSREGTVMSIARRYGWPQSSTSELLANLVDLGLLYKNAHTRTYTLTPRTAMLGCNVQPGVVRSGKLFALLDRLAEQNVGLDVGVFGLVNLDAQVFASRSGEPGKGEERHFCLGRKERLSRTAAGLLLLSTTPLKWREAVTRRLNAAAPDGQKFNFAEMTARIQACQENGYAIGAAGFGSTKQMCAILVPNQHLSQPLAISLSYEPARKVDAMALVERMIETTQAVLCDDEVVRKVAPLDRAAERMERIEARKGYLNAVDDGGGVARVG
jgi:DNA-binding IclR family transcriptional regulator